MRTTWTFHTAGQLVFGRRAAARLGEIACRLGVRRAFVVTDPVLLKAGLVEPIHGPLSEAGVAVEVFSGGEPEPSLKAAVAALAAARLPARRRRRPRRRQQHGPRQDHRRPSDARRQTA